MRILIEYLGELGPRWGLPKEPCRVHADLYLCARPVAAKELSAALGLDRHAIGDALVWLDDYRLVEATAPATWRTNSDLWELMLRALEERRRREAGSALEVLREGRGDDPAFVSICKESVFTAATARPHSLR